MSNVVTLKDYQNKNSKIMKRYYKARKNGDKKTILSMLPKGVIISFQSYQCTLCNTKLRSIYNVVRHNCERTKEKRENFASHLESPVNGYYKQAKSNFI